MAFPEETADGGDNLFRTVMKLVASRKVPAYEFVDGRESFTPSRRVDPAESMRRFDIPFREAKGSTLKAPVYEVESADIPSDDVKSYYLIERWEFNRHTNRMETRVEAICPVLHRTADIGLEPLRYPAFWVRMDDMRPYLTATLIATSDDNNLATHTLADFFNLRLYTGEIYKTGDRRNRPLAQISKRQSRSSTRATASSSVSRPLKKAFGFPRSRRSTTIPPRQDVTSPRNRQLRPNAPTSRQ